MIINNRYFKFFHSLKAETTKCIKYNLWEPINIDDELINFKIILFNNYNYCVNQLILAFVKFCTFL